MKLNGIDLKGRTPQADAVLFVLTNTDPEAVAALSGQTLIVTDDGGAEVERYDGFVTSSIAVEGDNVNYKVIRKLDANSEAAIKALEANVQTIRASVDATAQTVTEAKGVADEAKATADDATAKADEAKEIAEQAGTDPQVQTIARLAMPSIDFASVTATDVVAIPDYIPEWSTLVGQKLKKNSPCRYNGTIYRASQDVTVQDIYPPDVAGESQYYPIEVAPDGIIVYRECHGDYDMVRAGETRHYPDAEGPVYRAKVDTAYDPDTVPDNWELV